MKALIRLTLIISTSMVLTLLRSSVLADENNSVCHVINLPSGGRVRIETYFKCDGEEKAPEYIQCPIHSYQFPRSNQTTDMIRVKTPIPEIENGTLCTWVTVAQDERFEGTLMSYGLSTLHNAFAVLTEATDKGQIRVMMSSIGRLIEAPLKKNPSHLCVSFSAKDGLVKIYVDGKKLKDDVKKYINTTILEGGGIVYVGQEQDDGVGRGFDGEQAFKGNITNYMFWKRQLTADEIADIAQECICPNDYLFNLDPEDVILHGDVTAINLQKCPTTMLAPEAP